MRRATDILVLTLVGAALLGAVAGTARAGHPKLRQRQLIGCRVHGPNWVFNGSLHRREIALTFDDGPDANPPAMAFVNLLHREHVPATFFEVGNNIPEYDPHGGVERRMLDDGDMIGDHTWSHPDMLHLSAGAQEQQIRWTAEAIEQRTGFRPCLFRAPFGDVSPKLLSLARAMGFATVQWDVDPRDWTNPGVGAIVRAVLAGTHDGAIVIQHFGGGDRHQTLAALPAEIRALRARGYRFVTVTKLLGYRLVYRR